ncbi:hypothetical protein CCR75_003844 [Bremia lactucae]|uniref:Acyl-CoA synthetase family member 3, mitochondrial n=1 Tax=Bremia lactucae TaxID=4779 RepID=A0A976IL32_BRELC|nr:hypothetical protein CCR75_003844 [Bremia lactucae]
MLHIFEKLLEHEGLIALTSTTNNQTIEWTYADLLTRALTLCDSIQEKLPTNVEQPRVALLGARGASYVILQLAIWLAGGLIVPLHPAHPADEMQYMLSDSGASLLVINESIITSDTTLRTFVNDLPTRLQIAILLSPDSVNPDNKTILSRPQHQIVQQWLANQDYNKAGALMIYTSGTTGRPKGVLTTHAALTAQIHDVTIAWEMTSSDHLIHFLPLHHIHGVLNNLLCILYIGGSVEFLPHATPSLIWSKLSKSTTLIRPISILMAVPTVYLKLLEEFDKYDPEDARTVNALVGARRLRVAISGSMACPVSILNRWEQLTGHRLLERYGMTELGMVLTNSLHGDRHLGYVGTTFPSIAVRVVDPETELEIPCQTEQEGELRVKGPTVFREYWNKPDATAKAFDQSGWFKTGDLVQYCNEFQSFRIRGRMSADILKTAGYKVSALDVERVLLMHPQVLECAVFGLADEMWGQVVAVVIRADVKGDKLGPEMFCPPLRTFSKQHLANYRVPRKFFFVDEIPKNAMGKVNKNALAKIYSETGEEC